MSRSAKKKYIAICVNDGGTYGDDFISAGGKATIIQTSELDIEPFAGDEINRNIDNGASGNSPVLLVGTHVTLSFNVEAAGSGTNTTPVPYAGIFNIAGYEHTAKADHVLYNRLQSGVIKDATVYYHSDGALHKITGARAEFSITLEAKALGQFAVKVTGLYGGIVSNDFTPPDLSAFQIPKKVGSTYTTFKLDGTNRTLVKFEGKAGNEVNYIEYVGKEAVEITDWAPDGSIIIEAPPLGDFDPFAVAASEAQMPIEIVHGVPGNRITIASTKIQLGRPKYGSQDGVRTYELAFRFIKDFTIKSD